MAPAEMREMLARVLSLLALLVRELSLLALLVRSVQKKKSDREREMLALLYSLY
jgi:hypothetical protein